MTAKKTNRPRIGDECWWVEWCSALAFDSCGDVDRDNCETRQKRFTTKDEAEKFAREIYPVTTETFGVVEIWPARFEAYDDDDAELYPHVGRWEAIGDVEYFEGDQP